MRPAYIAGVESGNVPPWGRAAGFTIAKGSKGAKRPRIPAV
jgi:hypothetical protein